MAHEKLVSMQEEKVPQDLDRLEKDVMTLLDQQQKEATNKQPQEQPVQTSKFAAPDNDGKKPRGKKAQVEAPQKDAKVPANKNESRFLFAAPAPQEKAVETKFAMMGKTSISGHARTALQLELDQIRYAKDHQHESTARLLKGLAQGDDAAENYVVRYRPELLKRMGKAPGA